MSIITHMQLDFNLLNALDALLDVGSVAGAAERLHLSQPAMSRTLGRIREATGDQIMVRVGHRMVPTTYAASVREQVHDVVRQSRELLAPNRDIDIKTVKRTFTICCNELVIAAMGWRFLQDIHAFAPGIKLRLLSEASFDTSDLHHGHADLELSGGGTQGADLCHETVFQDRLAIAVRNQHPWLKRRLTPRRFSQGEHVIVSRRGQLRDPLDAKLEAQGLTRRVIATSPTAAAALTLICESDCMVVVPKRMSGMLRESDRFKLLSLPFDLEPVPLLMTWHRRYDRDQVHLWLRSRISSLFKETRALGSNHPA